MNVLSIFWNNIHSVYIIINIINIVINTSLLTFLVKIWDFIIVINIVINSYEIKSGKKKIKLCKQGEFWKSANLTKKRS